MEVEIDKPSKVAAPAKGARKADPKKPDELPIGDRHEQRQRVMEQFNVVFTLNAVVNLLFAVAKLKDWVGRGGMDSRRCSGKDEDALTWANDTLFFLQLTAQVALLVYAPNNILWVLGDDSPFAGDARKAFYSVWWSYLALTIGVLLVATRIVTECGVACDDYCIDHIVFTIGDWVCLCFNFALLGLTWTDGFRKAFTAYARVDATLGNPPTMDWSVRPTVRAFFVDGSGAAMTLSGVQFECLLVNDAQPFLYDVGDLEDNPPPPASPSPSPRAASAEQAPLLPAAPRSDTPGAVAASFSSAPSRQDFVVDELDRLELQREGITTYFPHAVRIATITFPANDLGVLELRRRDMKLPPTLSIPDGSLLVIRPRGRDVRARVCIEGRLVVSVLGTRYAKGGASKRNVGEVMVSHVVRTNKKVAMDLRQFVTARDHSVFICEDIPGGESFRTAIAENSMHCRVFVLLLDVEWLRSGECRFEFNMALRMNLKTNKPAIMVMLMSKDQSLTDAISFYPDIEGMLHTYPPLYFDHDNPSESFRAVLDYLEELQRQDKAEQESAEAAKGADSAQADKIAEMRARVQQMREQANRK